MAEFIDAVIGQREGFLALAFGRAPYWNDTGRYQHKEWTETRFRWPTEMGKIAAAVDQELALGEPVDIYVCPAIRFTNDRRKGSALPPMVCWADLDGPPADTELWETLNPLVVDSGQPGHQHAYVPITRAIGLGAHARLNKALADRLGGDAKWTDESLLRLPGSLNFKLATPRNGEPTGKPARVLARPWAGTPWDPDKLAELLDVDLQAKGSSGAGTTTVDGEPVDLDKLPAWLREKLNDADVPADRSEAFHGLVGACRDAGLTQGQTVTVMGAWRHLPGRYANRLAPEVARCWGKVDAGPTVITVDDTPFWSARPELERIHTYAQAQMASPWGVLAVALARVVCQVPVTVVLPDIIYGNASLNLTIALVAESGGGKGGCTSVAASAVRIGATAFDSHTLGSGQGIAHGYGHYSTKDKQVERHADSVLFTVEEVDHLAGLNAQTGSTTLAELRRFGMGEKLGHLYVDTTRRVQIAAHSYRGAIIISVQPGRAGVILDATDGGTPQRFFWAPAFAGSAAPDTEPDRPDPWPWSLPSKLPDHEPLSGRRPIPVCHTAAEAVRQAQRDRNAGKGDPLDGHALLTRERIAAALGILNGHYGITDEDWTLAGDAMAVSDAVRGHVVATLETKKKEANTARGKAEGERDVVRAKVVEDDATRRVARLVKRKLASEWIPHNELRKKITSRDRGHFDTAVEYLVAAGQIDRDETDEGVRYRLTEKAS